MKTQHSQKEREKKKEKENQKTLTTKKRLLNVTTLKLKVLSTDTIKRVKKISHRVGTLIIITYNYQNI